MRPTKFRHKNVSSLHSATGAATATAVTRRPTGIGKAAPFIQGRQHQPSDPSDVINPVLHTAMEPPLQPSTPNPFRTQSDMQNTTGRPLLGADATPTTRHENQGNEAIPWHRNRTDPNRTRTNLRRLDPQIPRHRGILPQEHERGGAQLIVRGLEVEEETVLDVRHRRGVRMRETLTVALVVRRRLHERIDRWVGAAEQ